MTKRALLVAGLTLALTGVTSRPSLADAPQLDIRTRDGKILIAAEEILAYDWSTHTMTVHRSVRPWLLNALRKGALDDGTFVVAVDGKPIYSGAWMSCMMSSSRATPVIVLDAQQLDDGLKPNQLRIDLGYPSEKFFAGADPRGDERIKQALAKQRKLASVATATH